MVKREGGEVLRDIRCEIKKKIEEIGGGRGWGEVRELRKELRDREEVLFSLSAFAIPYECFSLLNRKSPFLFSLERMWCVQHSLCQSKNNYLETITLIWSETPSTDLLN
jgi:hypothetical protein